MVGSNAQTIRLSPARRDFRSDELVEKRGTAAKSGKPIGHGMADDHLHMAVSSNGTVYAAVKTSYDTAGQVTIGLLVRRPDGGMGSAVYR